MTILAPGDGYRRWAPLYGVETAVSWLEERAVQALPLPTVAGRLLDVGCGTARRLEASRADEPIGVDLSVDMLRQSRLPGVLAAADVRALPFADASFDWVWCRLMLGHLPECDMAYD